MNEPQKKIFILVDWFAPGFKAGGPIQSCVNLAIALKNQYRVYVFTSDTDHGSTEPYKGIEPDQWTNDVLPGISVYYSRRKTFSVSQVKKEIENINPDYIYLNHMFSPAYVLYPLWLKYKKAVSGKIVLCPRGALYDSALSVKPYKKIPFLFLFKLTGLHKKILFHATNNREENAIRSHFKGAEVVVADNIPNVNQQPLQFIEKETGFLKMLFAARIHPIKNLLFLIECLKAVKTNMQLTIAGPIEDKTYWEQCREQIAGMPQNIRVNFEGPKENNEILNLLLQHHLFALPTEGENFGHSIFESFLCGRPVLISDQTPWQQLSSIKAGWELPLTDQQAFINKIETAAAWSKQEFDEWCSGAWKLANTFISNPQLLKQYYLLFS